MFQVLDSSARTGAESVTLRVSELDAHVERLRQEGVDVPEPVRVEGFANLWFCQFKDPEGNTVGLPEGA